MKTRIFLGLVKGPFGKLHNCKGAGPELLSPRNGIVIDSLAEKKFGKGHLCRTNRLERKRKPGMLWTQKGTKSGFMTPKRLV